MIIALSYIAIQQTIDYFVTSYLRSKQLKQRIKRAREALLNVPKVRVINTNENAVKADAPKTERKRRRRARVRAIPQVVEMGAESISTNDTSITLGAQANSAS
ncbi:hypothetical protein AADW59_00895 [Candidatus Hodgkinia cicadicola]